MAAKRAATETGAGATVTVTVSVEAEAGDSVGTEAGAARETGASDAESRVETVSMGFSELGEAETSESETRLTLTVSGETKSAEMELAEMGTLSGFCSSSCHGLARESIGIRLNGDMLNGLEKSMRGELRGEESKGFVEEGSMGKGTTLREGRGGLRGDESNGLIRVSDEARKGLATTAARGRLFLNTLTLTLTGDSGTGDSDASDANGLLDARRRGDGCAETDDKAEAEVRRVRCGVNGLAAARARAWAGETNGLKPSSGTSPFPRAWARTQLLLALALASVAAAASSNGGMRDSGVSAPGVEVGVKRLMSFNDEWSGVNGLAAT